MTIEIDPEDLKKILALFEQDYEAFDKLVSMIYDRVSIVGFAMERGTLNTRLRYYLMLKYLKQCCDGLMSGCNIEMEKIASAASKIMQAEGEDKKHAFGHSFTPDTDTKVNCPVNDKPALIEWLKNHPLGRELVKEEVHHKTLSNFVKTLQAEGKDTPPMVTTYDVPTLSVRKLPAKTKE